MEPGMRVVIKESDGTDSLSGLSIEHFRQWFSWPVATISLPLMPESDQVQMNTSLASEMEVIKKMGFLKGVRCLDQMECPRPSTMVARCQDRS